jgi:hypothetical protein
MKTNVGVGVANFEFKNSTIWYSKETAANAQLIIDAAEAARDAGVDVRFSYGKSASPNGTSAVSSELGVINGVLLPQLPNGAIALAGNIDVSQVHLAICCFHPISVTIYCVGGLIL